MISRDFVDQVLSAVFEDAMDPRISVVGCGGAGCNVVSALHDRNLPGVETVAVNTDADGLDRARADLKILLAPSDEGGSVVQAAAAAEGMRAALRETLAADIVFVVAGLGGGAGSGATPVLVDAAKEGGAVTLAIAILPMDIEGRQAVAKEALARLKGLADTVVVVDNNSLTKVAADLTLKDAFGLIDRMVIAIVEGVIEHLGRAFLTTVAEEAESVAREVEAAADTPVTVEVAAPLIRAATEIQPVAFDATGFIGYR
jgi:cell division protein FtsZ